MDDDRDGTEACSNCLRLQNQIDGLTKRNQALRRVVRRQRAQIQQLQAGLARLEDRLRELEGPARATAANSSLAPSANPIGAASPVVKKPTGRSIGGQLGHKGHGRSLLPIDEVDEVVEHRPGRCPGCGALLKSAEAGEVVARHQVMELPPRSVVVVEHQAIACCCRRCGGSSAGEIPAEIRTSVCGPRLSAAMGYLSARAAVSRRQVAEILSCVLGVHLSTGSVCARERELAAALHKPYLRLKRAVRMSGVAYVDETGWKGAAQWLWVAASGRACAFLCSSTRSFGAFENLLGSGAGLTICSDRFGVYDRHPLQRRGLCWSHLKRDFQRCVDRGGGSVAVGREGLAICREVFICWGRLVQGLISRRGMRRVLAGLRERMMRLLKRGSRCVVPKTARLCGRLGRREAALWRFVNVEGLEPTNNLAERMLRGAVIWRKKSFGSFSGRGCRFVERTLSVISTLRMRGRDVLDYLQQALAAHRLGQPPPLMGR